MRNRRPWVLVALLGAALSSAAVAASTSTSLAPNPASAASTSAIVRASAGREDQRPNQAEVLVDATAEDVAGHVRQRPGCKRCTGRHTVGAARVLRARARAVCRHLAAIGVAVQRAGVGCAAIGRGAARRAEALSRPPSHHLLGRRSARSRILRSGTPRRQGSTLLNLRHQPSRSHRMRRRIRRRPSTPCSSASSPRSTTSARSATSSRSTSTT